VEYIKINSLVKIPDAVSLIGQRHWLIHYDIVRSNAQFTGYWWNYRIEPNAKV